MDKRKRRILSFDGGGLRGLMTIEILERISRKLGGEAWLGEAELYAGTSTGGLVALALASGKDLARLRELYTKAGPRIFDRRTPRYFFSVHRLLRAGYANAALKAELDDLFGTRGFEDLERNALIVSFALDPRARHRSWAPKIFQNYPGPGRDHGPMVDVALATSAAPTYLPSWRGYVDGGVCANDPSMCALAQVLDRKRVSGESEGVDDVRLASFGTGERPMALRKEGGRSKALEWGALGWNLKLLRLLNDGPLGIVDYQCDRVLGKSRYLRVQPELPCDIELDDAKALPRMGEIVAAIPDATIQAWADWIEKDWL